MKRCLATMKGRIKLEQYSNRYLCYSKQIHPAQNLKLILPGLFWKGLRSQQMDARRLRNQPEAIVVL
jgi:hypothetical protein